MSKTTKPAAKSARDFKHDPRVPSVGSTIKVDRAGKTYEARVLAEGFEFRGKRFGSLSGIARAVLGCEANGFLFFGLTSAASSTRRAPKTKSRRARGDRSEMKPVAPKAKSPGAAPVGGPGNGFAEASEQRRLLIEAGIQRLGRVAIA